MLALRVNRHPIKR